MSRRKNNWSDLPPELLSNIGSRLETQLDILYFRGVCKDWVRPVSPALLSNKNVLCPVLPHDMRDSFGISKDALVLVAGSVLKIKPSFSRPGLAPWLVAVVEVSPGRVLLRKPFSWSDVVGEPGRFPEVLDLGGFEVEEMVKFYSFRIYREPGLLFEIDNSVEDHKVLLIVDSDGKTGGTVDDCIAVVLHDNGTVSPIPLKDENVKRLGANVRKVDDIVMFKGMVYAIDRRGRLYWLDNSSNDRFMKLVNVVKTRVKSGSERAGRLVESCGELYVVVKVMATQPNPQRKCVIRVYKFNQELMTWDEINSIGDDRILFVTPDCGFFARASGFCGWKGDCVVFYEKKSFIPYQARYDYGSSYWSDKNKLGIQVYYFKTGINETVQDCGAYSVVFSPRPKWISRDSSSSKG